MSKLLKNLERGVIPVIVLKHIILNMDRFTEMYDEGVPLRYILQEARLEVEDYSTSTEDEEFI